MVLVKKLLIREQGRHFSLCVPIAYVIQAIGFIIQGIEGPVIMEVRGHAATFQPVIDNMTTGFRAFRSGYMATAKFAGSLMTTFEVCGMPTGLIDAAG